MQNATRSPVRQSLLRPQLMMGAERELVMGSGMIVVMLVFGLNNAVLAGIGIAFWLMALPLFQKMAKSDPELTRVYVRHVNKKIYYPAAPHYSALEPQLRKHQ